MVKLADTLDLGSSSRECRFKSCYPHQKSKLFSPACEHVLGAHGAPAELRRRKEFFLILAEHKLRCGNVVYMKRRVWFLIVTKPLLPAFGQVGEKGGTGRRRVNQHSSFYLSGRGRYLSKSLAVRNFRRRSRGPVSRARTFVPLRREKGFFLFISGT